jgi:hypothetical protein
MPLHFGSYPINATHSICNVSYGEISKQFYVNQTGNIYDSSGKITNNFTIFWVHIVIGAGSETVNHIGRNFSIFDILGILGAPDTEYMLTITENYVYWAEEPGLHGAQFSLKFEIRDLNGVRVAKGELDCTCGMLFIIEIGAGNLRTLQLIDTNYDISRNRLTGWPVSLITAIITPILVFCFLHFYKKEPLEKNLETTLLIALGETAFIVDIMIDVWMYATIPGGFIGNLIIHGIVAGCIAAYALWRKIGFKWAIPAILELAYLIAMLGFTSDSYVPHLTAFMGAMLSWLCVLWAMGYERVPSKSKLGKLVSEIV